MSPTQNHPLQALNTFGISAKAQYFTAPTTLAEIQEAFQWAANNKVNVQILGGGSNVLFTRPVVEGMVLQPRLRGIEVVKEDEDYVWVKAAAGEVWHDLVLHTLKNGWGGLENLALIWGWVGAAPMQNIGAYGVEVKDTLTEVEFLDRTTNQVRTFSNAECRFGYRESVFKHEWKGKAIILSVTFKLSKHPAVNVTYGAITDVLKERGIEKPGIQQVADAVMHIRQSKLPDPREVGNAGSFFKNPEVPAPQAEALKAKHPAMPTYPAPAGLIKIPAGWLIEQAGWKGFREGDMGVHPRQALVLVNYGEASGPQLLQLAHRIVDDVDQKFGIRLVPEVNVL